MIPEILESARRLHDEGNLAEAGRLYSDVLRVDPRQIQALYGLALVHAQGDRYAEAEHLFGAAIRVNPHIPELFHGRGSALQNLGRYEEALASFARALSLKPDYVEARNNRGVTLLKMKRYQEALAVFDMLNADSEYGRALILSNRAAALLGLQRHGEALDCAEKSLALVPGQAHALTTYAAILIALQRYEEAIAAYDLALRLGPENAQAWSDRGSALRELGRFDEALQSYDRAIELKPDFADAFNSRGMVRLLLGRYREGWPDHEWRWQTESVSTRPPEIAAAPWRGEDLTGRRLAIYSEQGLGDIIQFARYLPLLARSGARVTFCAPAKLVRLLRPLSSEVEIVSSFDARTRFDFQCALMSIPLWLGTELHSIPGKVPYLGAEGELVARWKRPLGAHGFKIGIAWQGAPGGAIDQGRSIPLTTFAELSHIDGVRLISLQKTHGLDQLARLPSGVKIETLSGEFDGGSDAFVDTAAIMSNLDLIVTSDTSIAHLAGALGRPAWVALKYVPDWRWLLHREDSPWYPTLRLFRQKEAGNWTTVFAEIERALRSELLGVS